MQTENQDEFLSFDFGHVGFDNLSNRQSFMKYRQFVYEAGILKTEKGQSIEKDIVAKEASMNFKISKVDRFL